MVFLYLARYETLTAASVEMALGFGDSNGTKCGDYCEIRGSDSRGCGDILTAATVETGVMFGGSNANECGDYCDIRGSDSRKCGDWCEVWRF